jgi:anti-sigma-K factor RskA
MNTTPDNDRNDLRYAEYVLGVLETDARVRVARELQTSETARTEVANWQRRLYPLGSEIAECDPPSRVWRRICRALGHKAVLSTRNDWLIQWWENLNFWRWLGLSAGALATACLLLLLLPREIATSARSQMAYLSAVVKQPSGEVGWTVTVDVGHGRMVVVPAAPQSTAPGRAPELWLIPAGQKPIAVGIIGAHSPMVLVLSPALVAKLHPASTLAVSLEPPGGSPTGQPTGPVIASGPVTESLPATRGTPLTLGGRLVMPEFRT